MALLNGRELGSPRLCCGADAVQHAEGGQPLDQMGAVDLGERRLLLVLGALAVSEGADVGGEIGGESRLLLGRVLVVPERGVGLGRVVVHRGAKEEQELWALVWLVSDVCLPTEHPHRGEREKESAVHEGACVEERGSAAAAAARRCAAEVQLSRLVELCVAPEEGAILIPATRWEHRFCFALAYCSVNKYHVPDARSSPPWTEAPAAALEPLSDQRRHRRRGADRPRASLAAAAHAGISRSQQWSAHHHSPPPSRPPPAACHKHYLHCSSLHPQQRGGCKCHKDGTAAGFELPVEPI
eukprot:scaffold10549_cov59-Phaeocystis_antarctica.AAC.2